MISSTCQSNAAWPGRTTIRAPTKPTPTAAQRLGPTGSPSSRDDRAVTMIGLDSEIDAAVASGR